MWTRFSSDLIATFTCTFMLALVATWGSPTAWAALLPLGSEQDSWSDMAFPSGVTGSFNSGTKQLTISAIPSNDLEIGQEFGPSNIGRHYGTSGTLGGPFSATLNVNGVVIEADGSITSGGTVTVTFNGSAAASIGTDYGIFGGAQLLVGTVLEVLLDATGDNTLDVLIAITGGALQNDNPDPDVGIFAPNGLGLLRIAGVTMPSSFTSTFSINGATTDVLGLTTTGDYNDNGVIDAADYTVWRNNLGSLTALPNDDTTGVGPDDYTRWKTHFGESNGAGGAAGAAIPEPATAVMLIVGILIVRTRGRAAVP